MYLPVWLWWIFSHHSENNFYQFIRGKRKRHERKRERHRDSTIIIQHFCRLHALWSMRKWDLFMLDVRHLLSFRITQSCDYSYINEIESNQYRSKLCLQFPVQMYDSSLLLVMPPRFFFPNHSWLHSSVYSIDLLPN